MDDGGNVSVRSSVARLRAEGLALVADNNGGRLHGSYRGTVCHMYVTRAVSLSRTRRYWVILSKGWERA